MRIDIITCLPGLLEGFFSQSIIKRASDNQVAEIVIHDLRNYGFGKNRQIDDYAFGGGAGMVMRLEPLVAITDLLMGQRSYDELIYVTPDGKQFNQKTANKLSLFKNLIIVCGHYKGIDERFREKYITLELSIGDFVVSGGEIPAALIADAVIRLLPGTLNDETSALTDSFQDGLLAPPVYTRPADYQGMKVPDVLLSGDFNKIEAWRLAESIKRTKERRPDLLDDSL